MITGTIMGICVSKERGIQKEEIPQADILLGWGISGDAHGGNWHRQVSLLSYEKIEEFKQRGAQVNAGAFGENLIVKGIDLRTLPLGSKFQIGDAELELTQIGKQCHSHCEIYKVMGDCIMPREGVFAKVLSSGHIKTGDEIRVFYE